MLTPHNLVDVMLVGAILGTKMMRPLHDHPAPSPNHSPGHYHHHHHTPWPRRNLTLWRTTGRRVVRTMCRLGWMVALLCGLFGTIDAFTRNSGTAIMGHSRSLSRHQQQQQHQQQHAPTRLGVFRRQDPQSVSRLTSPVATSTMALPMFMASSAPFGWGGLLPEEFTLLSYLETPLTDPLVEAELFSDLAHVSLDLVTLVGPGTLAIRTAAVLGRLFAMAADYVPDHYMVPEEVLFQVLMLGVAWVGLVKAALPWALAKLAVPSFTLRDGKAFLALFKPAGATWEQFQALSACAMDWVTLEAGAMIATNEPMFQTLPAPFSSPSSSSNHQAVMPSASEDYVYWLYRGDMIVQSRGQTLYHITRPRGSSSQVVQPQRLQRHALALGLLGEMQVLQSLEDRQKKKRKISWWGAAETHKSTSSSWISASVPTTIQAGPAGATLLRIHTSNLSMLMENDADLAAAMRTLMFQGVQAKLAAQIDQALSPPAAQRPSPPPYPLSL